MSSTDRRGAPDPPGTVAVLFSGRHSRIFQTLNDIELPDGSVKTFWGGSRGSRCQDLNDMVAEALRTRSYWVWFISEDYGFERNILMDLLSRNEAMVAPISVEGYDPYLPKAWNDVSDEGIVTPLQLNQVIGPASLIDVRGASVTGMLVRRAVFEAMAPPWFRMTETMTEDVYFCFPPDAIIDGDETRKIIDVEVGDSVVTHTGASKRVRDKNVRHYNGPMMLIRPAYDDAFRVTPNHRLLVKRNEEPEWINASAIEPGDRLCTPKVPVVISSVPVSWEVEEHVQGLSVGTDGSLGYARTRKSALRLPAEIAIDIDLARLLGYFVAEGSVDRRRQHISLNFGEHEVEYIEDAVSILEDRFGLSPDVYTNAGCTHIAVSSAILARMFSSVCRGRLSKERRLPIGWRDFGGVVLAALITGYWRGDGCYDDKNGFRMTTASPNLASDLRAALLRLGIYAGVRFRKNAWAGTYTITIPAPEATKFGDLIGEDCAKRDKFTGEKVLTQDESFYYVRVSSVSEVPYSGWVFNLSVEEDESYTVNGFAAHNCERAREVGFQVYVDTESRLSTLSVAAMTPRHKGGRWELGVDVGDDMHFTQPLKHR